jgi:hypothetical protein
MDSWVASDTDALQFNTRIGAPGGRVLPIRVICVMRGQIHLGASEATRLRRGYGVVRKTNRLSWGKGINDFFEAWIAAQRVPKGQQLQLPVRGSGWVPESDRELFAGEIFVANPSSYRR